MQIIINLILTTILFCSFTLAQSLPELEKVKEIKLLSSTREDVRTILADYKLQAKDVTSDFDIFLSEKAKIEVSYSDGDCKNDELYGWDVPAGIAIHIEITPNDPTKLQELGINLSKFKRENRYTNQKQPKLYHRKDLGTVIIANEQEVETIYFEPSKKYYLMACDKERGMRLFKVSSYFDPNDGERPLIIDSFIFVNVTDLIVSSNEISASCDTNKSF